MNSYQMVLHRPVEPAGLFGRFSFREAFYVHLNEATKSSMEFSLSNGLESDSNGRPSDAHAGFHNRR